VDDSRTHATREGLEQGYVVVPADKRLLLLFTFLKKNLNKKVMVFFSSCNSVKYHRWAWAMGVLARFGLGGSSAWGFTDLRWMQQGGCIAAQHSTAAATSATTQHVTSMVECRCAA
jgi:hypothetical protein